MDSAIRRGVLILGTATLLCYGAPKASFRQQWQTFTATAYSIEGTTASGKQTVEGLTVAADPAILPVGTKIQVRGAGPYSGIYTVQDTGPKIRGREIDIFITPAAEAKRFGKKRVLVRVLRPAHKE